MTPSTKRTQSAGSTTRPRRDDLLPRFYRWRWVIVLVALAVLIVADRSGCFLAQPSDDYHRYHGVTARVLRVIEPTILELDVEDAALGRSATHVRLWGIRVTDDAAGDQSARGAAWQLVDSLVAGRTVTLHLEPHRPRDDSDRVLAHIHVDADGSLNEALLSAGLARADDRLPHGLLHRYARMEQAARQADVGIWASSPPPQE